MPDIDAHLDRRRSIAIALLLVVIGIGIEALSVLTRNNQIDFPLVSNYGHRTAISPPTSSTPILVCDGSVHSVVEISKSNDRPRDSDLLFDAERAARPTLAWKNDDTLLIDCEKSTRIMTFANWWFVQGNDVCDSIGFGITCGSEGWREP